MQHSEQLLLDLNAFMLIIWDGVTKHIVPAQMISLFFNIINHYLGVQYHVHI